MQLPNLKTIPTLVLIPRTDIPPQQFPFKILRKFQFSFPKKFENCFRTWQLRFFADAVQVEKNSKNSFNNSFYRSCPPGTSVQQGKLDYHVRVVQNLKNPNSAIWYPNDLKCNSTSQLLQHFSTSKHKLEVWNCTPKYCSPCGIYWRFRIPQICEAHISCRKHNKKIGGRVPSIYGFRINFKFFYCTYLILLE